MKNGNPDIMDLALNIRPHYKNIEEALKVERPDDMIIKILSNKFAIVKSKYTDGTYSREYVMGIGKGTGVFSYGSLEFMKTTCERVAKYPNCTHIGWYLINPQTKMTYYKVIHSKQSKYKQCYRKISKLI
jgi:hypothetical protein